jgi:glycosyltransferase involved in cell wall biosynthesis
MRIGIDCRKIADFGIGTYIRGLLHALVELGGDEYVAFGGAHIAPLLPPGVEHVIADAPHYSVRELLTIGRAADGARLDLFHAPHYVVPVLRTPFVVTIHDVIHLHHRNPLARLYARTMIGRAIRKSRRVLTVSESVRSELATFGHAEKIVVTPNGVDAFFFDAQAGLPAPHHNYFLFVGNDKAHKNIERLVEAFAIVRKSGKVRLVLAGGDFSRFARRDGIVLAGLVPREQLATLYRGAIALVQPSVEEGFGLPAAEAMASGSVVITSTAQSLMEVTGDGALHVAPDSIDAIASAMLRVMREPSLRATLIDHARKRAREFTWQRCAMITRDAYRAALSA